MRWVLAVVGLLELEHGHEIQVHAMDAWVVDVQQVEQKEWAELGSADQYIGAASSAHLRYLVVANHEVLVCEVKCAEDDGEVDQAAQGSFYHVRNRALTLWAALERVDARHLHDFRQLHLVVIAYFGE